MHVFYVACGGVVGRVRDYANARDLAIPDLARGVGAKLKLRLFAAADLADPYPLSELSNIAAWRFVLDDDFNSSTAPLIVADNSDIAVATVTDTIEESERSYTEVTIPISAMDTTELAAAIGSSANIAVGGELSGYDANGNAVFLLQIDNITIRNRRESTGTPTPVSVDYLTEAQTRALIAGVEAQIPSAAQTATADALAAAIPPDVDFTASSLNASHCLILTAADNGLKRRHPFSVYDADGYRVEGSTLVTACYSGSGNTLALTLDFSGVVANGGITGTWKVVFGL